MRNILKKWLMSTSHYFEILTHYFWFKNVIISRKFLIILTYMIFFFITLAEVGFHVKEIQVTTRWAQEWTDLSEILASAYRLLLIRDEVRNGSPGPWTAWSQSPPSVPVIEFMKRKHIKTSCTTTNSSCCCCTSNSSLTITKLVKEEIHFTFGALWPIGACGPRRDLIAKRMICLLTKINNSTNTCKQNQKRQDRSLRSASSHEHVSAH